jgi:hypothetical protein
LERLLRYCHIRSRFPSEPIQRPTKFIRTKPLTTNFFFSF